MELVKVNNTNFVRDINSMAIMTTDNTEKNEYYSKLRVIKKQKEEMNDLKTEINSLKGDMDDIKSLLQQLISKG
jgi:cell shape-determining protein MreC